MAPPMAACVNSKVWRRPEGMPRARMSVKATVPTPPVNPIPNATTTKVVFTAAAWLGSRVPIAATAKSSAAAAIFVSDMTVRLDSRVDRVPGANE